MKRKVLLTMLCLAISVSAIACGTENTAEQQEVITTDSGDRNNRRTDRARNRNVWFR